jgi:hypothetical protein
MAPLPSWEDLEPVVPQMVATMRHYLTQIDCVLRPERVRRSAGLATVFKLIEAASEHSRKVNGTAPGRARARRRDVREGSAHRAAKPGRNRGRRVIKSRHTDPLPLTISPLLTWVRPGARLSP